MIPTFKVARGSISKTKYRPVSLLKIDVKNHEALSLSFNNT